MLKYIFIKKIMRHTLFIILASILLTIIGYVSLNKIQRQRVLSVGHIINNKSINILYLKTIFQELLPRKDTDCNFVYKVDVSNPTIQPPSIRIECYTQNVEKGVLAVNHIRNILKNQYNIDVQWDIYPMVMHTNTPPPLTIISILSIPIAITLYAGWYFVLVPLWNDTLNLINETALIDDESN